MRDKILMEDSNTTFGCEHESLLERIITQLYRARKLSTSNQKLINSSVSDINNQSFPCNYIDSTKHLFINRSEHLDDIEGDYNNNRSCRFHYFHLYLNLTYFLFIVPYRPVLQDRHYKLLRNKIQKVLCMVSCALVLFRQFTMIRATWARKFHHPTIFYFYLAHVHLHIVMTIVFYWSIFSRFHVMQQLLEKIGHCYLLSLSAHKRNKIWLVVIFLHIFFPVMGIVSPTVGNDVIDSWSWTPSWLFRSYVSKAKYAFFLCTDVGLISKRPEWSQISSFDIGLTSFYMLIIALNELNMYLMSLMFGICSLTLWTGTNEFKNSLQLVKLIQIQHRIRKHAQATVLYLYYDLKGLSNTINDVWGLFCFFYIIDIIPYLATDLDFGLRALDWFDALKMSRSVFFFGWNIIISAETYRKMQWFSAWLLERDNRDLFESNSHGLTLLLEEEIRTLLLEIRTDRNGSQWILSSELYISSASFYYNYHILYYNATICGFASKCVIVVDVGRVAESIIKWRGL